ncbi:MAG: TIGR03560 family F420-dependent LLM class oxidoreductase [Chloroflexota bacterium]|nr:TIGR03560 family F420-dependent LLM class oxidoreductase [Chloroflexota bacterium]
MTEPQQGLSYDEILALARAAEAAGLEAFFRSDHYASFPGPGGLPTTDAWATLAGLARETSTIRIGSLVSPVTFRIPGVFAKMAATVNEMSGGRLEVGMGAGWNDQEHHQLGIPYPPLGGRYDRLEEALAVVHGLWTEPDGWSYAGSTWQVRDALFRPRPTSPGRRHPNLILGGDGGPRLARLVATYADEFNRGSASPDNAREAYTRVRSACERAGRDPDSVVLSAMVGVLVAESESELRDRLRQQVTVVGSATDADEWLAERRDRWIIGTPEQARQRIEQFAAAGAQRIMLQDFLPRDLEMVSLLGRIAAG